ncbi:MAG: DUF5115 domain-containing protein [Muribaculaceae bacterium]|nr:DUF5115 domain-containing protein [Muribaculaceae bacterium]
MKKIVLYSMLAVAGMMFTACNDDYKDWNEPQSQPQPEMLSVDFQAASVGAIDLRTVTDDNIQIFTPTVTANKEVTATYDAIIYNDTKTDSVIVKADAEGKASTGDVRGAVMALFGVDEVQREAPMNVVAYINVDGTIVLKDVEGLKLTATPKYQDLPPVWYILGVDVGIGTWVNSKRAVYTSLVAMYVNPYNYDELIYASYFPAGSEFRIHPEVGNKDMYIGGGDENGGQSFQAQKPAEGNPLGNVVVKTAGNYKITVNLADPNNPTMRMELLAGEYPVYSAMATTGVATDMKIVTRAQNGINHDWYFDGFNVTDDGQVVGFTGTTENGTTIWGGKAFPAGKAAKNVAGVPAQAGNYVLIFNDLLGVYRFIEKE